MYNFFHHSKLSFCLYAKGVNWEHGAKNVSSEILSLDSYEGTCAAYTVNEELLLSALCALRVHYSYSISRIYICRKHHIFCLLDNMEGNLMLKLFSKANKG